MTNSKLILQLEGELEQAIRDKRYDEVAELRGRLRILHDAQRAKEFIASRRCFLAVVPEDLRLN